MKPHERTVAIAVAPNGARKTKADHPALPMTPAELAACAQACCAAGAAMIHVHVRDKEGRHILDAEAYRAAFAAIRSAVGDRLILQATTEAVGIYPRAAQMALLRKLRPEAASLAIREIMPDAASEAEGAAFLAWAHRERIWAQYILYNPEEVVRFETLRRRGVIPTARPSVLLVLGRYTAGQQSAPRDLLPFLSALDPAVDWSVCAFGRDECACALAAAALGGGARVGFENNLLLADGATAPSNAALVAQLAAGLAAMGRRPATADELRARRASDR
ncbi:MAG TPA: 3-keto-5-aminohexanoate cleavage protein [Alphaproteobacteria bacterium]|nr:3-keto-5-aminohexanoate cleavage protein [Alphaproteobacteria bacterium]